jgi:oligosaccharide repeat unit polymerase
MSPESAVLAAVATLSVILHYHATARFRGLFSLDGLFLLSQWLMLVGTLLLVDFAKPAHAWYATLMTIFIVAFAFASCYVGLATATPVRQRRRVLPVTRAGMKKIYSALAVSFVVTIIYYALVGHLALFEALRPASNADITTLRLDSYAGDRYLAPGYFNQVKNAVLPSLAVATVYSLYRIRVPRRQAKAAVIIVGTLVALLGTAQRGAFVVFVLSIGTLMTIGRFRVKSRWLLAGALVAFAVFSLATVGLGRSDTGVVEQAWHRAMVSNQAAGLAAFEYTSELDIALGAEWAQSLRGLLPGRSGSDLASLVFEQLFGSRRGTAPPSLVGSIHHNFGGLGVAIFGLALGAAFQLLSGLMFRSEEMHVVELVGMAGFAAVGGAWIAGSPAFLINTGLATFAFLWVAGRWVRRRRKGEPVCAPLTGSRVSSGTTPAFIA